MERGVVQSNADVSSRRCGKDIPETADSQRHSTMSDLIGILWIVARRESGYQQRHDEAINKCRSIDDGFQASFK